MKYSAPRGTVDILMNNSSKWQKMEQILRTVADKYHVAEMRTPIFEHTELFNRVVGDTTDVVSKEMYTFPDKKGRSITLRPEGTAGIARAYVENKLYALPEKLLKVYYMGPMFRYERPQSGRQRQFHQFGVEMLGVESPYVDVECMMMAVSIVATLGIKNIKLHINSLGDDASRDAFRDALQAHFKPYLDELCTDCQVRYHKNPLRILDCKVDAKHAAMKQAPRTIDYLSDEAKAHFDKVCELLDLMEIPYVIDSNLVRGLDYYSHTVFEIISDDPRLGAGSTIGGGGRYNGLVEEIGGPSTPGVGFAFGLERLMIAMDTDEQDTEESLDIYLMPLGDQARNYALQIATMLRSEGFSCDLDYVGRGLKGQFKSADRFHAALSLIMGDQEVEAGIVNVRDNQTKNQEAVRVEELVAYLDHYFEGE